MSASDEVAVGLLGSSEIYVWLRVHVVGELDAFGDPVVSDLDGQEMEALAELW